MTRRHGPERNKQPAATRKALPATIYLLRMTATKHPIGEAVTTATHRSLNVNFLHRAEQGITPSEAVPSLVDLEPAAGNDCNNTLMNMT